MKLFSILLATSLLAEDPKPKEPPKPPVISAELRAKFWKAELDYVQAKAAADAAMVALQASIKSIEDACGANYTIANGADREPVCQEKPKPAEKK
jgi:hypothetical protein